MADLSLEEIELIKTLAHSDSILLQKGMNDVTRHNLDAQIGVILREYYKENTQGLKTNWTEKFEKVGITKDDGKAAIACARRLGIDIS